MKQPNPKPLGEEKIKSPLIHLAKRDSMNPWAVIGIRAASIVVALLLGALVIMITGNSPFKVYETMLYGSIGNGKSLDPGKFVNLQQTVKKAIPLLGCALAIAPCFKMRFWNIGAEGQITAGALAAMFVYRTCGSVLAPDPNQVSWLLLAAMALAAILGGGIWAMIPGFFKAKWNTNETLFTLMMNYIIIGVVAWLQAGPWEGRQGRMAQISEAAKLPKVLGIHAGWIIVLVLVVFIFIYMRFTKHGYEVAVIGDSGRTAQYAGMNVGWIMVRTMLLSGAICGLVGFVILAGENHTLAKELAGGVGFTAITVAWLSQLNPFVMIAISLLLGILTKGASNAETKLDVPASVSDVIIGLLLLCMLGCEFFINYRLIFRKKSSGKEAA